MSLGWPPEIEDEWLRFRTFGCPEVLFWGPSAATSRRRIGAVASFRLTESAFQAGRTGYEVSNAISRTRPAES